MRWPRSRRTRSPGERPLLSLIVIVYKMPEQAARTLTTLTTQYQRDVTEAEYEVIVVENRSDRMIPRRVRRSLPDNFRYFDRAESGVSPAHAINFGSDHATGEYLGFVIDGARMLSPGVIRNALDAFAMRPNALVVTPSLHIGEQEQHVVDAATASTEEAQLLSSVPWREDGYRLFDISVWSPSNPFGYLHPIMESNCMFASRERFERIGRADTRFDLRGGGMLNLDMYREMARLPDTKLVFLMGEGSFHQFHGGVTTQQDDARELLLAQFRDQYTAIRGEPFRGPLREPMLLGQIHPSAAPFLRDTAELGFQRFTRWTHRWHAGTAVWDDDVITMSEEILDDPFGIREDRRSEGEEDMLYLPPSIRHFELDYVAFSTWGDHVPFAYDIVEAHRPELLVELGSAGGVSYFAFCQSVRENDLDTLCYAVDTWEGEKHTGTYDDSVYRAVEAHNRLNYSGFSYLLRMYFNEALDHFADESIDLLHIDGLHTYDAVAEDFSSWYPKVRPGGIILFHDVKARMKDFGVWRFWEELTTEHDTFTFKHGFGLGVLRKPGGEPNDTPLFRMLFDSSPGEQELLREFYVHAAQFHDFRRIIKDGEMPPSFD